jgi:predicted TIM-barrel enzyme
MARIERAALLEKFRDTIRRRQPTTGGGAGTGLSAKCEEAGGIDLIVIYNSGRYRMAGRGYVLKHSQYAHGAYSASSMERLPTETALTSQTSSFKSISFSF